jgi:hypothetical protein
MLNKASAIQGCKIEARDGHVGTVTDLLFDDASWTVRWLVVETGAWLENRPVLLPIMALGLLEMPARSLAVNLTRAEVQGSPGMDTERPVSRQMETDIHDYYGASPYWESSDYMHGFGYWGSAPLTAPSLTAMKHQDEVVLMRHKEDDPHLRSIKEVLGYHIHAADGDIGHLADALIDSADWSLRYLVVNTSNWWMGKDVLISPRSTQSVQWSERKLYLSLDRDKVRNSPAYDSNRAVDETLDTALVRHYGPKMPEAAE